jgi:hypothetical protein
MRDAPVATSGDSRLDPELARQLGSMRGGMVAAAEAQPMPPRFSAVPHPDRPAMVVVDEETGRSTTVGLYAYGATRQALQDLFG